MIETGQVWTSGGRRVRVVANHGARVVVRDTYGWRRTLTADELKHGFSNVTDHVEPVRRVMARRALADVEAA